MILLIDNYDSFTFNLLHLIGEAGFSSEVVRNDALTAAAAIDRRPEAIVLSPGPCTPDLAGICLELVTLAAAARIPLFGVCLGMQSIAQAFGGKIVRAQTLKHGKTSDISHEATALFKGAPNPLMATRYHSLIVEPQSLPSELAITARSNDDSEIMAIEHRNLPITGVQFHPESIASEFGRELFVNFMNMTKLRAPKTDD